MLFFELLQIAIGNREAFSHVPSEEEWNELYLFSQKHTLAGIAFLGIERLPETLRPPKELMMQWYVTTERIKALNDTIDKQALKVAGHFLNAGFRSMVLKGQGMAKLYGSGRYRTPGDIDIWLEGERTEIEKYVRKVLPQCEIVYHHADFRPIGNTEVEVHFTPSWMNCYFTNRKLQRFFKCQARELFPRCYASEDAADGALNDIPVPSLAFNRVYILVHIYRHLFGEGIGLRQLLDYYYVLLQGFTEAERTETLYVLKELRMLRFAGAVMWVLQTVYGMPDRCLLTKPNEKEGRFLLDEILLAGNFGHHDPRINRVANASELRLFVSRVGRNFRFLRSYPSEVLWSPLFKVWHFFWRRKANRR